ncbi:hypothetical protein [Chachezhania sediminis]|uniref:hypothetical protein n=1 Tax=Chachezhania sediminis TaxID=2599291 RepID=UPI00131C41D3|nr:hypothetical protein [Chachezhania sediminis]
MIFLDLLVLWWVWLAAALVLATLEVLVPGFVFLGFAISALLVGLLLLILPLAVGALALLVIFAVVALVAWIVLRRLFALPTGQVRIIRRDIND